MHRFALRSSRVAGLGSLVVLSLALLAGGGPGCTPRPSIVAPADLSTIDPSGDVNVSIDLHTGVGAGSVQVKLLTGVDEAPAKIADVSSRFTFDANGLGSGTLSAGDLAAGRNTLTVAFDSDGNGAANVTTSSTFSWQPQMRAAACKRVITPVTAQSPWLGTKPEYATANHSHPIYMAGFSNNRTPTGVHDDLWARGVVIESRGKKIAMVVVDLVGYFNNEINTIRSSVSDPSLDAIVVSSTHNHEGPDTMGLWGQTEVTSGVSIQYLDFVNAQVAGCIADAKAALEPADIRFATGDTIGTSLPPEPDLVADGEILQHLCVGRNAFFDGQGNCVGGQEVFGDAGPIRNPSTPSFQLRRAGTNEILATLVNYASHPESLGSGNREITSDFPHYMREALEARYGGVAIYMSADLGVLQGPLDVFLADPQSPAQQVPRRTFQFAQVMGEILADRAGDALDAAATWSAGPRIDVQKTSSTGPVYVPVANPYFRFAGLVGIFGRRGFVPHPTQPGTLAVTTELMALRIGDAQFAVTPNELDPQIGDHYRAQMSGAAHRFLVGLGNDEIGYQMPAAKFNPSCFLCFEYNVFGDDSSQICPIATNDCGTVFQNNIGPDADLLFQPIMEGMIGALNP